MFIGHFAAAFAAKKIDSKPSLGTYFLAAQWLDLIWPLLLLTGLEKVELATDPNSPIPLSFTHYPISHSLLAVAGWALLFAVVSYLFNKNLKVAVLLAALVMSHWVLDWFVHIPDLPLTPGSDYKTGLGLWHQKWLVLAIELIFFGVGVLLYTRATLAINKTGAIAFYSLVIFLVLVHLLNIFGPPPTDVQPIAIVGLSQWLLVAWAYWADRNRRPI
ncbi:metal-dependent hydrolase [Flavihumibacter sp.]|uniref:metal-dependent hydrolase n=1 Tax=Flavihumibacter sp. TaxID=1913981 RepID=UPI002FCAC70D|nr:metal-dependent hydrolase [Flavihumibacter sediminis]